MEDQQQQICAIDFKKIVENYVDLCRREKSLKDDLKLLKGEKDKVTDQVLAYMKDINVESCRLPQGQGRVVMKTSHTRPKLSSKEIQNLIATHSPSLQDIIDKEEAEIEEKTKVSLVHKK